MQSYSTKIKSSALYPKVISTLFAPNLCHYAILWIPLLRLPLTSFERFGVSQRRLKRRQLLLKNGNHRQSTIYPNLHQVLISRNQYLQISLVLNYLIKNIFRKAVLFIGKVLRFHNMVLCLCFIRETSFYQFYAISFLSRNRKHMK